MNNEDENVIPAQAPDGTGSEGGFLGSERDTVNGGPLDGSRKPKTEIEAKAVRKLRLPKPVDYTIPGEKRKPRTKNPRTKTAYATKHPWERIREHYLTTDDKLNMIDLAKLYNVNVSVIRNRAAKERWTYLRAQYQTEKEVAIREARTRALINDAVSFDDNSLKAAKLGQTLIMARLTQIAQLMQAHGVAFEIIMEKMRKGVALQPHEMRGPVNYRELQGLADALGRFQDVGRKALGTDTEKLDLNILNTNVTRVEVAIGDELQKPDLDRTAAVVETMRRAGLHELLAAKLALPANEEGNDGDLDDDGDSQGDGGSQVLEGEVVR